MSYLLICGVVLVLLVTGFNRVYCIHGINQVYLGLYKGMFDEAVVVADESGNYLPSPLFYLPRIERLLKDYYAFNLPPYCRDYAYEITGTLVGKVVGGRFKYADTVSTSFTAYINDVETRVKKAVFTIERSPIYERS